MNGKLLLVPFPCSLLAYRKWSQAAQPELVPHLQHHLWILHHTLIVSTNLVTVLLFVARITTDLHGTMMWCVSMQYYCSLCWITLHLFHNNYFFIVESLFACAQSNRVYWLVYLCDVLMISIFYVSFSTGKSYLSWDISDSSDVKVKYKKNCITYKQ